MDGRAFLSLVVTAVAGEEKGGGEQFYLELRNQSLVVKFLTQTKSPQKVLKAGSPTNTFKVDKADTKDFF